MSYVIDVSLVTALFGMTVFVTTYLLNLFFQHDFDPTQNGGPAWAALGVAFAGLYWWLCLAVAGRTLGKAILGMRVVNVDGTPVGPGAAFIRTLVFPFSFILGIGFIPIVTARDRRLPCTITRPGPKRSTTGVRGARRCPRRCSVGCRGERTGRRRPSRLRTDRHSSAAVRRLIR